MLMNAANQITPVSTIASTHMVLTCVAVTLVIQYQMMDVHVTPWIVGSQMGWQELW